MPNGEKRWAVGGVVGTIVGSIAILSFLASVVAEVVSNRDQHKIMADDITGLEACDVVIRSEITGLKQRVSEEEKLSREINAHFEWIKGSLQRLEGRE